MITNGWCAASAFNIMMVIRTVPRCETPYPLSTSLGSEPPSVIEPPYLCPFLLRGKYFFQELFL